MSELNVPPEVEAFLEKYREQPGIRVMFGADYIVARYRWTYQEIERLPYAHAVDLSVQMGADRKI